ncbi:MAG TPA: O-antigen ligase family protein [Gammaproteobacteria bacterium]|nr:O-antigen ligase family protein [Gammaproteobacteria bacterium]
MLATPDQLRGVIRSADIPGKLALILVLLFPIFSLSLRHWLSGIYSLLLLVSLYAAWRGRTRLYREEKILFLLLTLFLISFFLSATLNDWTDASIRRLGNVGKYLFFFPLYLFIRQYPDTLKLLLTGIVVGAAVLGLQSFYDMLVLGLNRGEGIYGPIIFGDLAALFFAITLILLFLDARVTTPIWVYVIALMLSLIATVLSTSRNGWIAAAFSLVVVPWLTCRHARYRKTILAVIPLVMISAGIFLTSTSMQDRLKLAWTEFSNFVTVGAPKDVPIMENSVGFRLEQWRVALHIVREAPLFGVGGGNAGRHITRYAERGLAHPDLINPHTLTGIGGLHSSYFESLVNEGIVGLLIILAFILYPLWVFIRIRQQEPMLSTVGIIFSTNFLIFGITENPFVHDNFTSVYLLFLTVFFSAAVRIRHSDRVPNG